jgi:hypothetical protein
MAEEAFWMAEKGGESSQISSQTILILLGQGLAT